MLVLFAWSLNFFLEAEMVKYFWKVMLQEVLAEVEA